jgi:hypothetical protein
MIEQMTEAERRAELERFELMCKNWIDRHGKANRKLYLQFVRKIDDPRIKQAILEQRCAEIIEAGRMMRLPEGRLIEPWRFLAVGIAGKPFP